MPGGVRGSHGGLLSFFGFFCFLTSVFCPLSADQNYCLKRVFMINMLLCFAGGILGIVV